MQLALVEYKKKLARDYATGVITSEDLIIIVKK
jgi:hypothetical protein